VDFRQLESGSSNQVAEQNHVDVWPSEGMAKSSKNRQQLVLHVG